jgi:hypothetical protein
VVDRADVNAVKRMAQASNGKQNSAGKWQLENSSKKIVARRITEKGGVIIGQRNRIGPNF